MAAQRVLSEASGYLNAAYAESLREFGEPVYMPSCGAWVLSRSISGCDLRDFTAPYPLLVCENWRALQRDVERLEGVSFTAATDPLAGPIDCGEPYKTHFIADLRGEVTVHSNHRRKARRALEQVQVTEAPLGEEFLAAWCNLYGHLKERHSVDGLRAFSLESFRGLFRVPGLIAYKAELNGVACAAILVMIQGSDTYYHLGASSPEGYEASASYGLFWHAIHDLRSRGIQRLCLGAAAGVHDSDNGLARFKAGWSNTTASNYLIRRVLDERAYSQLTHSLSGSYFPLYRQGEFGPATEDKAAATR